MLAHRTEKIRFICCFSEDITVFYDNEVVGEFVADIIVEDTIILELKAVRRSIQAHGVQVVNYLVVRGKPLRFNY